MMIRRECLIIIKCTSTQLIFHGIKGPSAVLLYYAIMYIIRDDASSLFVIRSNTHTRTHVRYNVINYHVINLYKMGFASYAYILILFFFSFQHYP